MFQHFLALLTLMLIILLDITLLVMKQGEEKTAEPVLHCKEVSSKGHDSGFLGF